MHFQQNLATVIASMTYQVGCALAFIIPPIFIKTNDKYDHLIGKQHMKQYIIAQSIAITIFAVIFCIFFRSKPQSPPSAAARIERTSFWNGAKSLIKNCNYWVLTIAFMFYWSLFVSMGVIISQITSLYDYSNSNVNTFETMINSYFMYVIIFARNSKLMK